MARPEVVPSLTRPLDTRPLGRREPWDPAKHPRTPKGKEGGGRFTDKPGGIPSQTISASGWSTATKSGSFIPADRVSSPLGDAVYHWRSITGYQEINGYLRHGTDTPFTSSSGRSVEEVIALLRGAMTPSTNDIYVLRGVAMDRELEPGDRFTDRGIVSVTADQETVQSFPLFGFNEDRPYTYELTIIIPKGTKGLRIDGYESIVDDGTYRVESIGEMVGLRRHAVVVREDTPARRSYRALPRKRNRPDVARFIWTPDDIEFLPSERAVFDPKKHPRRPSGKGGGQFVHSPAGGLVALVKKPLGFTLDDKPIGVGSTLAGLPADHPKRKAVDRIAQSHGFKDAQQAIDECADEMDGMLNGALIAQGRAWYRDENIHAHARARQYGTTASVAAGVESATSPRCRYITNQKATDAIFERYKNLKTADDIVADIHGIIMNKFKLEGARIAKGESPDSVLSGAKRRSFYNNILLPGKTNDVTIDTRMATVLQEVSARHARGAKKPILPAPTKREKDIGLDQVLQFLNKPSAKAMEGIGAGYYIIADAVRTVAAKRKESPDTIQAAVWIAIGGAGR